LINDVLPRLAGRLLGNVISRWRKDAVYLTFDDGPDPALTSQLGDLLIEFDCPASFFVTTSLAKSAPLVLLNLYDSGFTIGSHGHYHSSSFLKSYLHIREDLELSSQIIEEIIGVPPRLFRPPFGRFSYYTLKACGDVNLNLVLWSLSVKDWQPTPPAVLSERILRRACSGDIILLHDHGAGAQNMLEALPAIINGLRDNGFTLKALPRRGL